MIGRWCERPQGHMPPHERMATLSDSFGRFLAQGNPRQRPPSDQGIRAKAWPARSGALAAFVSNCVSWRLDYLRELCVTISLRVGWWNGWRCGAGWSGLRLVAGFNSGIPSHTCTLPHSYPELKERCDALSLECSNAGRGDREATPGGTGRPRLGFVACSRFGIVPPSSPAPPLFLFPSPPSGYACLAVRADLKEVRRKHIGVHSYGSCANNNQSCLPDVMNRAIRGRAMAVKQRLRWVGSELNTGGSICRAEHGKLLSCRCQGRVPQVR